MSRIPGRGTTAIQALRWERAHQQRTARWSVQLKQSKVEARMRLVGRGQTTEVK